MPFVTTDDGAKIHYLDNGGTGPAVVLGHGYLMDADSWLPLMEDLAPDYRVIAIDARGHGKTEDPGERFDYWTLARDAWAVADGLGLEKIVTGGVFQGGFIGMKQALLQPGRVRGVLAIGSRADAYDDVERGGYKKILLENWIHGTDDLEPLAQAIAVQMIGGSRELRAHWIHDKWLATDRTRLERACEALLDRQGFEDKLKEITAPALIMHGISDPVYRRDHQERLASLFGGPTQVETIDAVGAAHTVTLSHPELTNPIIREWLASLPA